MLRLSAIRFRENSVETKAGAMATAIKIPFDEAVRESDLAQLGIRLHEINIKHIARYRSQRAFSTRLIFLSALPLLALLWVWVW